MADVREAVLARLLAIVDGIDGVVHAARNDPNISEDKLPAIIIFDGDEEADQNATESNAPGLVPNIVHMTPQVSVKILDSTEDVGSSLNVFRAAMIKAVLNDTALHALIGSVPGRRSSGNVRYQGLTPAISEGRMIIGQMNTHFRISYVLDPRAL